MAFRVKQDRDTVRATVARRDNIFKDDYVLVHLDTFNDQRQTYLLFFNPLVIKDNVKLLAQYRRVLLFARQCLLLTLAALRRSDKTHLAERDAPFSRRRIRRTDIGLPPPVDCPMS